MSYGDKVNDIDTILAEPITLKTITGEDIKVKKLSLRKELKIKNNMFKYLDSGAIANEEGDELFLEAIGVIIEKDRDWILDNLDMEIASKVVTPFFTEKIKKMMGTFKNLSA